MYWNVISDSLCIMLILWIYHYCEWLCDRLWPWIKATIVLTTAVSLSQKAPLNTGLTEVIHHTHQFVCKSKHYCMWLYKVQKLCCNILLSTKSCYLHMGFLLTETDIIVLNKRTVYYNLHIYYAIHCFKAYLKDILECNLHLSACLST